ncbi:MAG: SGNH hydrolase domain-containing protein, partial [Proteobacteria bacterium]|nr:SGNH hydrolase domain-containing protein [Pseudomonadota bacterium]
HELVVWGDSHAERMLAPVAAYGRAHAVPVAQRTSTACPPLLGVRPSNDDRRPNDACATFNDAVIAELTTRAHAGKHLAVVLVGRWPNYLATTSPEGVATRTLFDAHGAGDPVTLFADGLERTIATLHALGIRVLVVAPMPEFPRSPPECRVLAAAPAQCVVARAAAERYRARATSLVTGVLARHPDDVQLVDAFAAMCDDVTCRPTLDGVLAYTDAHHLAFSAAARLVGYFERPLAWATAN